MVLEATGGVHTAVVNIEVATEDHEVVAAPSSGRIRVLAVYLHSRLGAEASFHDGGDSISGRLLFAPNLEQPLAPAGFGWFDTAAESRLLLNTTNDLHGLVRYQLIG